MNPGQVDKIQGLRKSNAAGPHKTKATYTRKAKYKGVGE